MSIQISGSRQELGKSCSHCIRGGLGSVEGEQRGAARDEMSVVGTEAGWDKPALSTRANYSSG